MFTPRPGTSRSALARRLLSAVVIGLLPAVVASQANASRVVPGATPLLIDGSSADAKRCPFRAELDGSRLLELGRQQLRSRRWSAGDIGPLELMPYLPTPALVLCDPDQVAGQRPLGAFGGSTAADMGADIAYPGLRALGAPAEAQSTSQLGPGDRVTLPAAGPRTSLDVFVSTSGGAQHTRVDALGEPSPTALRIDGTLVAPVLVLERAGGETRQPVRARPVPSERVSATMRGRTMRFRGRTTAGSVATVEYLHSLGESVVTSDDGTFALRSVKAPRRTYRVGVTFTDLARRSSRTWTCVSLWSARRQVHGAVRCRLGIKALSAQARRHAVTAGRSNTAPGPLGVPASTPPSAQHPAQDPRPRATRAGAPMEIAPATATLVGRHRGLHEFPLMIGDVSGDAFPEFLLFDFDRDRVRLRVSAPGGAPARLIPIRGFDVLSPSDSAWAPDLDGDGRDELRTAGGILVTDALSEPTPPSRIDLRELRPNSARDLDLGGFATISSLLTTTEPIGALPDRTGDLRPEPVLGGGGTVAVFSSQDVAPGRRSRLAQATPLAWLDEATLADFEVGQPYADFDRRVVDAVSDPGSLVRAGRAVTLTGAGTSRSTAPRTFSLRAVDGAKTVHPAPTFTATGIPKLLDHDPTSGESLVALYAGLRCGRKPCIDQILRLGPAGEIRQSFSFRRDRDIADATFITDGPDSDDVVDLALWVNGGGLGVRDTIETAGRTGTVALAVSTRRGALDPRALPVLGLGSTPIHSWMTPESVVLADGSRWLALGVAVPGKRDTLDKMLVRQSP